VNDNRTDGNFILLVRPLGLTKGLFHPLFVLGHPVCAV